MTGSLVPPPLSIAGRYTVERELGHGATATVYLARDQAHGRPVALKVLRAELTASVGAERFLREIRLTAQLHHPHIVDVLDSGEHDGLLYCVLPYMDGGTLRDRLERERQLPIADAVSIARVIGEALAYAHERGIIHRDVKPENILFSAGQPCLADFGIARALETVSGDVTSTGVVRGTPAYMSPEQAAGEKNYDGRSDVYSLACVIYEAITGMPAFIGPNTQSLLAQRMVHQPREMSLYRERVSPELEAVVEKALRPAPADRYATAREFVDALGSVPVEATRTRTRTAEAPTPTTQMRVSGMWRAQRRWRAMAIASTAVLGVVVIGLAALFWRTRAGALAAAPEASDTTRIVLLPLERSPGVPRDGPQDELLSEAFVRWQGVRPLESFQVSDALARHPAALRSDSAARELARSLGAARFVRGTLTVVGDSIRVRVALFDVHAQDPLSRALAALPADGAGADSVFENLASALLLRDASDNVTASHGVATRSLPAVQALANGMAAIDDWNLSRADTAFQAAITYDPSYTRAHLWLAQERAWRQRAAATWLASADRAAQDAKSLSPHEQTLAAALAALAHGQFARACGAYDALRLQDSLDFTAWYGLGQCRSMDTTIVPDRRMPFGWRYRSSYHQAVLAYARAFEILPSAHRSVQRGGYAQMSDLLYARPNKLLAAIPEPADTTRYFGRPDWRGDTLVIVPVPLSAMRAGDPHASPAGLVAAVQHGRDVFHRIATAWSSALPRSATAKEAVAVSLEMLGDPSSIDTLHTARILAEDPSERARLAANEAILRVKFALPDDRAGLVRAGALADSLLTNATHATGDEARELLGLAMMRGRCDLIPGLARRGARPDPSLPGVSTETLGDAAAYEANVALGCSPGRAPAFRAIAARLADPRERGSTQLWVLTRAAQISFDSVVVADMTALGNDAVLGAVRAASTGNRPEVRRRLDASARIRRSVGIESAFPDRVYEESRLWLAIADTAAATQWLDQYLTRVRYLSPSVLTDAADGPTSVAALMRLLVLQTQLAASRGDATAAHRWALPVLTLWSVADPDLRSVTRQLQAVGK